MVSGSPGPRDQGVTLIETVVAMAVFTILSGAVLGLVIQAQGLNADSTRRNAATGLASSAIETVRGIDLSATPDPLPFGTTTGNQSVGGVTYTVTRVVAPASIATSTSLCTGGTGTVAYKRVTVTVTWPDRRAGTQPVRAGTLRALGFGTDNTVRGGSAAISVSGPDGNLAGIPVTVTSTSPAQTVTTSTGSDGCAVFTGLAGTAYSVSATSSGYTGIDGPVMAQLVGTSVSGLADGVVVRGSLPYAGARSIAIALNPPPGTAWPAGLRVTATGGLGGTVSSTSACPAVPASACMTAVPGTAQGLYPDTYTVQAGSCPGTPGAPTSAALVSATATAPAATTLDLGAVTARVTVQGSGAAVPSRQVTFTRQAQAGETCSGSEVYTATTSGTGVVTLALPYGQWSVTTTSNTGPLTGLTLSGTATQSTSARTATVNLTVRS